MHISLMCASEPSEHVPYPNLLLCLPLERPRVLTAHHTYFAQVKEDVCLLSGLWPSASLCRLNYTRCFLSCQARPGRVAEPRGRFSPSQVARQSHPYVSWPRLFQMVGETPAM